MAGVYPVKKLGQFVPAPLVSLFCGSAADRFVWVASDVGINQLINSDKDIPGSPFVRSSSIHHEHKNLKADKKIKPDHLVSLCVN
jgi:hypothetical protein